MEECSVACARIAATDCRDIGSECIDLCLRGSVSPEIECAAEWQSYVDCFWQTEAYTCSEEGVTQPTSCDQELAARSACLGLDGGKLDAGQDASPQPADPPDASD